MSDFENPLASKPDGDDTKKQMSNAKKWTIGLGIVGILVMIYLYSKSKSSSSSTASTTAPNAAGISSTMAAEQSGASAQAQLDQQMLQNAMSTSSVLGTSPGYTTSGGAPSSGFQMYPSPMVTASGSGSGTSTGTTPSTSGGSGYVAPQYPSSPQYTYLTPQADATLAAGTPLFGKTSSGQYVQVGTKGVPGDFNNGSRRAAMGIGTQLYTAG